METRCLVIPKALSDKSGTSNFDQGPERQSGWGGLGDGVASGSRVIQVETATLDSLVADQAEVRLVKIDVEGAEALVLEGARRAIDAGVVREFWFEDNKARREALGISRDRLTAALLQGNYKVSTARDVATLPMDIVACRI